MASSHGHDHPPYPEPESSGKTEPIDQPLRVIAELCREIAWTDLATVMMPAEHGDELTGSLAGQVFTSGEPLRMSHPG
jgi:hypothetical protein